MGEAAESATENAVGAAVLKSFMQRYERLLADRAQTDEDIRELLAELKGQGFDPKSFKAVQKKRGADRAHQAEQDAIERLYDEACR